MNTTTTQTSSPLSDLRARKGLTPLGLAELIGMPVERVEAVERGEGTGQEMAALCLALLDLPDCPDNDYTPSRWESARWDAGNHLWKLGERLMLLGDRLRGDQPQTVDEMMRGSYHHGFRMAAESAARMFL